MMTKQNLRKTIAGILFLTLGCTVGIPAGSPSMPTEQPPEQSTAVPVSSAIPNDETLSMVDFQYMGAFRLPGESDPPETFAYGGNAMTFNPDGDIHGEMDGYPGSLFIMGHDRIAYGGLADGSQVAEINIPPAVISRNLDELNRADFIQDFSNVLEGSFTDLEEIPRVGMAYLNNPQTGPRIHFAWGQHLQSDVFPTHGWFEPNLKKLSVRGFWSVGKQDPYSTNGYMFEIPSDWADQYLGGRYLATGRMRDGGMGGMGPSLFAIRPWQDDGSAYPDGTTLQEIELIHYETAYETEEFTKAMTGYQHADEWEGGAWITTESGKSAVLFAGTKSNGDMFWYGYMHPDGEANVCVDHHADGFERMCRTSAGGFCADKDLHGCCDADLGTCISNRGWWSNRFDAQLILYDPVDLARVVMKELQPWQVQPYLSIDIDDFLYLNPPEWENLNLGWGNQRRYRIGDVAYDRENGILYILELFADEAKPVVHVWQIAQ